MPFHASDGFINTPEEGELFTSSKVKDFYNTALSQSFCLNLKKRILI